MEELRSQKKNNNAFSYTLAIQFLSEEYKRFSVTLKWILGLW